MDFVLKPVLATRSTTPPTTLHWSTAPGFSQVTLPQYREHVAWDLSTRWFHWINALAVLGLIASGIVILNDDALGLSGSGKTLLKSVHVSFGYAMAANLLCRLIWAFFGNRYTRWRGILPGGALRAYTASFLSGEPEQYLDTTRWRALEFPCCSCSCLFSWRPALSSPERICFGRPSATGLRSGLPRRVSIRRWFSRALPI
jgi:hypothetical protein